MSTFPDPKTRYPVTLPDGTPHLGTVFLAAAVNHPRIKVGAYTYASAHQPPNEWAHHLAPYLYEFSPEKLVIGKFCQIANGVQFITASANHRYDGFSSFPFAIFDGGANGARLSLPDGGPDTVIGNDCWFGTGAMILPGVRLGNGVIVGAGAVVSEDVPPYSIVTGNRVREHRLRFEPAVIDRLQSIAWWDWPIAKIQAHEAAICGADLVALESAQD